MSGCQVICSIVKFMLYMSIFSRVMTLNPLPQYCDRDGENQLLDLMLQIKVSTEENTNLRFFKCFRYCTLVITNKSSFARSNVVVNTNF